MKNKKLFILLTALIISTTAMANNNTVNNNFDKDVIEKELNDDIYVEFVEGDVINEAGTSRHVLEEKYVFERDNYGLMANNIDNSEEEYIISSKVFELTNIKDDFEPFNRRMYAFNTQFDKKIAYPASVVYGAVVPKPIRKGIANFYDNFKEVPNFVNSILQLNPKKAVNSLGRFTVNSTIGILGVNDVASKMGLKKQTETMGDTLGHYGVGTGSYLVLPLLGPSNVRDAFGKIPDTLMESSVRGIADEKLFFDTGIFSEGVYGTMRPVVTGLNARSLIGFRYGDLNSPFEYDLVKAIYTNYRKIQIKK